MTGDGAALRRRAYLAGAAGLASLSGCLGGPDGGAGSGDGTGSERGESGGVPDPPDPADPLAERFEVERHGDQYRETPDGPLHVEAAVPAGVGTAPLLVHVHGGAWRYGDAGYEGMDALARAGIAVGSIEYRLSGTATYPAAVRDVVAGVRWLRANGPDWGMDPDRVALLGGSAGAHLGALVAAVPEHPTFQPREFEVDASTDVDAFVGLYGIYDLRVEDVCGDRNIGQFLGEDCDSPETKAEASPITHVDGEHPPSLLSHGTDDQLVPVASSREYRDALAAAGVPVEYDELEGVGHGFVDDAEHRRRVHERTVSFLLEGAWSDW